MSPSTPELPPRVDVEALAFDPVHRAPDRNPALVYLARLAPGSRRAMGQALRVLARARARPRRSALPLAPPPVRAYAGDAGEDRGAVRAPERQQDPLRAPGRPPGVRPGRAHERRGGAARIGPAVAACRLPRGRALAAGELKALFDACDGSAAHGARDAALLALLYGAGLRRSEAVRVELRDLDLVGGSIRVNRKRRSTTRRALCNGCSRGDRAMAARAGRSARATSTPGAKGGAHRARRPRGPGPTDDPAPPGEALWRRPVLAARRAALVHLRSARRGPTSPRCNSSPDTHRSPPPPATTGAVSTHAAAPWGCSPPDPRGVETLGRLNVQTLARGWRRACGALVNENAATIFFVGAYC